ncbi:MAG: 16S rRNA (guanine(966)-N(2))-methyltransferase RsmD [Chloroflexi bacterium]|nr:16S rRNA (guanine(966)-N(2))-methyltransferase RsmD [Chloroflexota bacterium]
MRVIAGEAKGRRLFSVPGETTRPITDRVKSALFNILGERVPEARFLDLFAGTGGVGIEALSRGATKATFVERNERALSTIRRNLAATGLAGRARVVRSDAFKFIAAHQGQPFDIVYVAPPQYQGLWARTLLALDPSPLLAENGLVVVQIYPKEYAPQPLQRLVLTERRKYGSTLLCFYGVG